jgi:hypothetical protein
MPVPGQLELHWGVAVKRVLLLEATAGVVGLNVTEVSVITAAVTVITVKLPAVDPLSVALTKMPPVTALVLAVNVTDAPVPLIDPSERLVSIQV